VLYHGHAVAAVAATSNAIADQALDLIEIVYETLPHVIDVEEAMAPDAPILHDQMFTAGLGETPTKASNIATKHRLDRGDLAAGFASADVIVETRYSSAAVHQGYIEPHACVASYAADGQTQVWSSSQGHFVIRGLCAKLLRMRFSDVRVIPAEIGGGFGGKTTVYLEPLALVLSQKSGHPVKMVMTREEVFRATGPTSASVVTGLWSGSRTGTLHAIHEGAKAYKLVRFGDAQVFEQKSEGDYTPMLREIIKFFQTKQVPVSAKQTLEIYAFMEAKTVWHPIGV
jgi:CO/xanthine dehydrogenase Mo-binding subunit